MIICLSIAIALFILLCYVCWDFRRRSKQYIMKINDFEHRLFTPPLSSAKDKYEPVSLNFLINMNPPGLRADMHLGSNLIDNATHTSKQIGLYLETNYSLYRRFGDADIIDTVEISENHINMRFRWPDINVGKNCTIKNAYITYDGYVIRTIPTLTNKYMMKGDTIKTTFDFNLVGCHNN